MNFLGSAFLYASLVWNPASDFNSAWNNSDNFDISLDLSHYIEVFQNRNADILSWMNTWESLECGSLDWNISLSYSADNNNQNIKISYIKRNKDTSFNRWTYTINNSNSSSSKYPLLNYILYKASNCKNSW